MSTEVVMPQMGESIAEGTITKWLKKVGEHVERDEPLFEISTDKVDAEIPSPAAGILTEVKFKEGETVEVNTVVAVLDGDQGSSADAEAPAKPVEATPQPEAAARHRPPPFRYQSAEKPAAPPPPPPPQPVAPPPPPVQTKTESKPAHRHHRRRHLRQNRMAQRQLLTSYAARSRARSSERSHKSTAWTFRDSKALV